jgi:type IV secretion system protein VirB10
MTPEERARNPETQPEAPGGARTRMLNRLPMWIVLIAAGSFIAFMGYTSWQKAQQSFRTGEDAQVSNSAVFARQVAGDARRIIPPESPRMVPEEPKVPDISVPVATPPNLDTPPLPERDPRLLEELNRVRAMRFQQFQMAIESKITGDIADLRTMKPAGYDTPGSREEMLARIAQTREQASALVGADPTQAYKMRLESLRASGLLPPAGGSSAAPPTANQVTGSGGGKSISGFDGSEDRWKLQNTPQAPAKYTLVAGSAIIPATLISGINSDLPGQVQAQVSIDVYDTATGKYLLIPQGTRLVGTYSSDVAYGQDRVLMAWQRLIFPDGRALDIGAMPGADSAGMAGFEDKVNHHYFRTFLSAALMSGVIAAVSMSQNRSGGYNAYNQSTSSRASDALSESLGQVLGQAMAQMFSKNLNISPTIEVRPGYRLNVMVTKDLNFNAPYRAFAY